MLNIYDANYSAIRPSANDCQLCQIRSKTGVTVNISFDQWPWAISARCTGNSCTLYGHRVPDVRANGKNNGRQRHLWRF